MNAPADNPFDTAAELEAEARMMENRAAEVRDIANAETTAWKGKSAAEYDTEARAATLSRENARLARADATKARKLADDALQETTRFADAADAAEAEGRLDVAAELREEVVRSRYHAEAMVQRAEHANDAAAMADAEAVAYQQRADAMMPEAQKKIDELDVQEKRADDMEDAALVMRTANAQLAEAERLDAAADDLESRGVAGADQVRAAAAQARVDAARTIDDAKALDPTKSFGTDANEGIDPGQIEMTTDSPRTVGDDTTTAGGDEIEMDPLDVSGDDVDSQIERELQYLEPLEPAPDPILSPAQVEPVAMAPTEPIEAQWDDPVEVAIDADPMPAATFSEPSDGGFEEPSPGLDEVGDDPVFDA